MPYWPRCDSLHCATFVSGHKTIKVWSALQSAAGAGAARPLGASGQRVNLGAAGKRVAAPARSELPHQRV